MDADRWNLAECSHRLVAFREARDWARFHTPKELAAALAIEAGELQETMLWKTADEVSALLADPATRAAFEEEVADVAICLLMVAERAGVDLRRAINDKIDANERRYPADEHRGIARKAPR